MAEVAERCMAVHNLNLFSNEDLSQDWEGGEDGGEGGRPVDHPVWQVVDLESIGQVPHTRTSRRVVCVSDDDDVVSAIDEFLDGRLAGNIDGLQEGKARLTLDNW